MVNDFSEKIDITDSNMVLQYGAAAQKNIASFSENTLNSVRTKDLGEVGCPAGRRTPPTTVWSSPASLPPWRP